jgi:putative ABC transport system permease protein
MKSFLSLFRRFIVRALWREKVRTGIVVLGMALGVAVMLSIRLANRSVTESFRSAIDSVGGSASLRIRGTAGRFDEMLLRDVDWLHDYGTASPVVETYAMAIPAPGTAADVGPTRGEMLQVLGVDVLVDSPIRDYKLLRTSREDRDPTPRELLRLLTEPDAVVLTQRYAARRGLDVGDCIALVFGSRRSDFIVRGLLLDQGPARALDGNFVLMDLAAAQWAAGRLGQVDYVDVKFAPDADAQAAAEAIQTRLPEGLAIERPDARFGRTETMVASFQFNLAALSAIALVVGLFLIYNTVSISVAARRDEIGMLQAVGVGRRTVLALFLGEAILIAAVGSVAGIVLGRWLASAAVLATSQTVETFYIAEAARSSASRLALTWQEVLLAVGLSLPLALVAAAVPALQAASLRPVEVIRGAARLVGSFRPPLKHLAIAAAFGLGAWLLASLGPVAGLPVFGFIAQLLLMLAGSMLAPGALWLACRAVRGLGKAVPWLGVECRLAAANLLGAIPRLSISVAALAVSLAMMVAVAVMVGSFRETVVYWLDSTLRADLFVRPTMLVSSVAEGRIDPAAVAAIRRDPEVVAVGWFASRQVPYGETTIRVASVDLGTMLDYGVVVFKSPRDAADVVRAAIGSDGVLVSESFSLRFGVRPGDRLALPTREGTREFPVLAVYYDYSSNQGTVLVPGHVFGRDFAGVNPAESPSSIGVYLRPGTNPESARARLAEVVGQQQELYFATNENIHREAMKVFDGAFRITYALEAIAIVVAGLGVVSTLIAMIYERQREIALLALSGATARQVRRMVVLEAVLLGGVSQALGIAIGLLLAVVLIYVINVQSFGWTIQFHLPVVFLIQSTLAILAGTALCGLYPAAWAAAVNALQVTREE